MTIKTITKKEVLMIMGYLNANVDQEEALEVSANSDYTTTTNVGTG